MKTNGGVTILCFIHKTHNEQEKKKLQRWFLELHFKAVELQQFQPSFSIFLLNPHRFNFKTTINTNTSFILLSENNFPYHPLQLLAQCYFINEHHSLLIFPSWCMLIWVQHAICFMSLCAIHANFHSREHLIAHSKGFVGGENTNTTENNIEFVNHVTCYHLKLFCDNVRGWICI